MSTEFEDYVPTQYFTNRGGEHPEQHAIGNSSDNLLGLGETSLNPSPRSILGTVPTLICQPPAGVPKPCRSDPDEICASEPAPVSGTVKHGGAVMPAHSADEDFSPTEYYGELRRRSLEGRAPIKFGEPFSYPLEQSLSSDAFDVAIY